MMSPKGFELRDRKQQVVRRCDPRLIAALTAGRTTLEVLDEMAQWRLERLFLTCPCRVRRHVADVRTGREWRRCLRRNPRTARPGTCDLCAASTETWAPGEVPPGVYSRRSMTLLLRETRYERGGNGRGRVTARKRGQRSGERVPRDLGILMNLVDRCGAASSENARESAEYWRRIRAALEYWLEPKSKKPAGDFAYYVFTPDAFPKPIETITQRLLNDWVSSRFQPEAWFVGVVDSVETDGDVCVIKMRRHTADREAELCRSGQVIYRPFEFRVPARAVSRVGASGPYLGIVACSLDENGALKARKAVVHATASRECLLFIESSHERRVVLWLWEEGVEFSKPTVADAEGYRPDMLDTNHRILIEIQGRGDAVYLERKHRQHEEMLASRYRGYELVRYDALEERFEDFVDRYRKARRRALARGPQLGLDFESLMV
jgi:hypothetical protein